MNNTQKNETMNLEQVNLKSIIKKCFDKHMTIISKDYDFDMFYNEKEHSLGKFITNHKNYLNDNIILFKECFIMEGYEGFADKNDINSFVFTSEKEECYINSDTINEWYDGLLETFTKENVSAYDKFKILNDLITYSIFLEIVKQNQKK